MPELRHPASRVGEAAKISCILFALFCAAEWLILLVLGKNYANMCQWDCGWYESIIDYGYSLEPSYHDKGDAANWAFFPAFPLAAKALGYVVPAGTKLLLVLTSKLFTLSALFSFILLSSEYRRELKPLGSGMIFLASPYAIYGHAGYSESLFFTLTCMALLALKRERFLWAGAVAGLLTGTRIVGGSIGFSYLVVLWLRWRHHSDKLPLLVGLLPIPLGLAAFMAYLHGLTGDALAFLHIQVAWDHGPGDIINHVFKALGGEKGKLLFLAHVMVGGGLILYLMRWKKPELWVFALLATLIPLSSGLISMPRYIWWQAPILLAVNCIAQSRGTFFIAYVIGGFLYSLSVYVAWLGGKGWVI